MKLVVINGTAVQGITYHMKEFFLERFRAGNEITEFYPQDLPPFCHGCKNCFLRGEEHCPHAEQTMPIWRAFQAADLLVFAYPVYALRAPASVKSLLDHFCVHWMVHRPDPALFAKSAVILTNSVGAPNGSAQADVKTSLTWMGVSRIRACGAPMMGDIFWDQLSDAHLRMLKRKTQKLADWAAQVKPCRHKTPKVGLFFLLCRILHRMVLKTEPVPSLDNQYFIDRGWIKSPQGRA